MAERWLFDGDCGPRGGPGRPDVESSIGGDGDRDGDHAALEAPTPRDRNRLLSVPWTRRRGRRPDVDEITLQCVVTAIKLKLPVSGAASLVLV